MAISNKPMDQWTLDDYVEYYGGSNRLFGNSSEFEAIKSLASELQEIDAARITNDMVYDRVHKLEELMGATFAYVNSHPDPSTSSGKSISRVTRLLMSNVCTVTLELSMPGIGYLYS